MDVLADIRAPPTYLFLFPASLPLRCHAATQVPRLATLGITTLMRAVTTHLM